MEKDDFVQFRKTVTLETRQQPGEETDDRKYYRARISSDQLDSHFSQMDISTLENFASEAARGVAVLDSHNHRTVGIGRSISGDLIDNEVFSDFYILKELDLNNQSFRTSDSFMKAIDSGMLQDVSVGFYGHREICQLCDEDLWGGNCRHWPGLSYIIEVDGKQRVEVCTTLIVDGHLSEFSLVYDGALEGAEVVEKSLEKAQYLYDEKELTDEQTHLLNTRHQIQFKSGKAVYEGDLKPNNKEPIKLNDLDITKSINNKKKESKDMNNEEKLQKEVEELQADVKSLKETNDQLKTENEDLVSLKVEVETLRDRNKVLEEKFTGRNEQIEQLYQERTELKKEIEDLLPIVEEGKKARVEAEAEALVEYIRYQGEEITEELEKSQKDFLSLLPNIEQVKNFRNQYASFADDKYPAGQSTKQPAAAGTDPADDDDNDGPILRPFAPTVDAF